MELYQIPYTYHNENGEMMPESKQHTYSPFSI